MRKTNLPAKITLPKATGVLLREGLFKVIADGIGGRTVWVCGHPGSGKTTLISSFIGSSKARCLWYRVDAGDRDLPSFFHYLGLAAVGAGCKKKLPHLTQEHLSNVNFFSHNFFRDLFGSIPGGTILVFDNFQEASVSREFTDVALSALQELPTDCSVIIISREEPSNAFARYCLNAKIRILGNDELSITETELRQLARFKGYGRLTNDAVSKIYLKTRGWMAGVLLMLESNRFGVLASLELKGSVSMLFNYFLDQVFNKIDEKTAEFLLKTSLMPSCFSVDAAASVAGNDRSEKILSDLISRNFFTESRVIGKETLYQYHPFFREFLLMKANEVFSGEMLAELRNIAAESLDSSGFTEDAAELLIKAGNWDGLYGLVRRNAEILFTQGRSKLLETWIKSAPGRLMSRYPWFLYYNGLCRMNTDPAEARELLLSAYHLFDGGDPAGIFSAWCGLIDTYLYEWKDFKPLDNLIEEFEILMGKYKTFPSMKVEEQASICMFNALVFRQPRHKGIGLWEERVKGIFHSTKSSERRAYIGRHLILYYMWTGAMTKGKLIIDTMSESFKSTEDPLAFLMWMWSKALFTHVSGNFSLSLKDVSEGLKTAELKGVPLLNILLYGQGIYSNLAIDNIEDAEGFLDRMSAEVHSGRCYNLIFYNHQAALVALHKGELSNAIDYEKESLRLSVQCGAPFSITIRKYSLANILIAAQKYDEAASLIKDVQNAGEALKSCLLTYAARLLECVLDLKRGKTPCIERLGKALGIGRANGIIMFPFLTRYTAAMLASTAIEYGVETGFVKDVIRKAGLTPGESLQHLEEWPWPFKIYTLGRFEIYRDGKKIEYARKAQQKPLALLKELVSSGGRPVSEDTVIDALWPDSEGDLAYRSFATTLHRLRKILGNDKAIICSDGMVSLDKCCFWVDAWAFNHYLSKCEPIDEIKTVEKAVRIYNGDYLPGEGLASAVSLRERLKDKFLKCIENMGKFHEHAGTFDKAIECYERGLEVDPLAETFYRHLMRCYKALNNRTDALKTYARLQKVLSNTFGVKPSSDTQNLYLSILNS